jgi:hypothetical protein
MPLRDGFPSRRFLPFGTANGRTIISVGRCGEYGLPDMIVGTALGMAPLCRSPSKISASLRMPSPTIMISARLRRRRPANQRRA